MLAVFALAAMAATMQPQTGTAAKAPAVRVKNAYEGGAQTRRTVRWNAPTQTANSGVIGNLAMLRDRSRHATRNDGYAKAAVDAHVSNIVGVGIKPLSKVKDENLRRQLHERWYQWTDESDADGLLDWYGQETQAVRGWKEAGEMFVRLRPRLLTDGLSVPLQVQVIEPELCPHTYDALSSASGGRVRAGIEFDGIGRRTAYYFHPQRPGDYQDYDASQLRRIPAESIIHLYDPLRAGQLRGLPQLTQALMKLFELDKTSDAVVLRQQLANMMVGFIKGQSSTSSEVIDPLTGAAAETYLEKPLMPLEPGLFQRLDPGEEVEWSDPPDAGQAYPEFMRATLRAAAVAAQVPYELLSGDLRDVNDRSVRVLLNAFRRQIRAQQHQIVIFQLCRRVWEAWLDRGFVTGTLPLPADYATNRAAYVAAEFRPERFEYIHPVQDVQAVVAEIRAGLDTRSNAVSDRGDDAEVIDAGQARDNSRADELGLVYDSDARYVSQAGVTQARPPDDEVLEPNTPAQQGAA